MCSKDIRDQNLKLSEVAPNLWCFWPSQILGVQTPKMLYLNSHACLMAHHMGKFREVTPLSPKVIGVHTLNFEPIFKFCLLKIVGGPISSWVWASKPWSYSNTRKKFRWQHPLGAEIWASEKFDLGWVKMRQANSLVSGPKFTEFFCRTWEGL